MKLSRKERTDYHSAFMQDEDSRYAWRKQWSESFGRVVIENKRPRFFDFKLAWENTRWIGYGIQRNPLKIGLWLEQFVESKDDKYIGKSQYKYQNEWKEPLITPIGIDKSFIFNNCERNIKTCINRRYITIRF